MLESSGGSTGTTRYTIEASAGHGGGISPDGRVRVSRGSDKTFRITPDAGYEIADVLVDGESDDPEYPLTSRTEGNRLVRLKGDKALIGQFADVAVTGSNTWALYGEEV